MVPGMPCFMRFRRAPFCGIPAPPWYPTKLVVTWRSISSPLFSRCPSLSTARAASLKLRYVCLTGHLNAFARLGRFGCRVVDDGSCALEMSNQLRIEMCHVGQVGLVSVVVVGGVCPFLRRDENVQAVVPLCCRGIPVFHRRLSLQPLEKRRECVNQRLMLVYLGPRSVTDTRVTGGEVSGAA